MIIFCSFELIFILIVNQLIYVNYFQMLKYLDSIIILLKNLRIKLTKIKIKQRLNNVNSNPSKQDLKVYWSESFRDELDNWGSDNVWPEIKYLTQFFNGKILDICCGTGATINYLKINNNLDLYGFDISDFLIDGSKKFKIDHSKIKVADATNTQYNNNEFEYSYSIGSLEHFTEKGIDLFLKEASRITSKISLHQIPISRDPEFQGWLKLDQSYFNMSQEWWEEKFKKYFSKVEVVDSLWADPISLGKWFICYK